MLTVTGDWAYGTQPVYAAVMYRKRLSPHAGASAACEGLMLLPPSLGGDQDELHQTTGGTRVMSRTLERQVTELHICVTILNRFTELGCPQTVAVA